jgi:uncharacterized protein
MSVMEKESLFEFPCKFPIKMMGREGGEFRRIAVQLVAKHVGEIADDSIQFTSSRRGNFLAITITIVAESQQQLDDIYRDLSSHDEIVVAL